MVRIRKPLPKPGRRRKVCGVRLYALEVLLLSGPVSRVFTRKNPMVARTILVRGDQTLADLHRAAFEAFGRRKDQPYEFQFGRGPMDPAGPRYVQPGAPRTPFDELNPPAGTVTETTLASLDLEVGRSFVYWFDYDEDWWHQITVIDLRDKVPRGKYPRVTTRVGDDLPQQAEPNGTCVEAGDDPDLQASAKADMACLVGELHLRKGDYGKAVAAFTRAIETSPTVDAYEGRAKAYRALAQQDEREADRFH